MCLALCVYRIPYQKCWLINILFYRALVYKDGIGIYIAELTHNLAVSEPAACRDAVLHKQNYGRDVAGDTKVDYCSSSTL